MPETAPDDMLQDRPIKAVLVVLTVALVCALLVSVTAVMLRPHHIANLESERMARLESILESVYGFLGDITFEDIEARVVNLDSGDYQDDADPASYESYKSATDPASSIAIPTAEDAAGIKRRENHAVVYLVRSTKQRIEALILPIRGVGYQSLLRGYLALAGDAREIIAFKVYEHGETPGLGSRIQDPQWEALWPGKQALDEDGSVLVRVAKPGDGNRSSRVDAISGATRTSMGVNGMLRFWLGELGFGPYLARVREGRG